MTTTLRELLTEAVGDFVEFGYDRPARLSEWMRRLRAVARQDTPTPEVLERRTKAAMESYFQRSTNYALVHKKHPGVSRFTLARIQPRLRPELTRRIQASTQLIKINRDQAIEKTLQRFSGWASSVPAGGSRVTDRVEVKQDVAKSLKQFPFEERRVLIDQGHKLMSSIDAVIAQQTGAIAGMWHSHWRRPGYAYRKDHRERDEKIYLIRGSWAMEKGLISLKDSAGYLDDMTQAGEEPFCSCYVVYFTNLRDLPESMLTAKGRAELERTRVKA